MGLRIAFLRPRLGIGGAERLMVDAAHELIAKGHDVSFHVPASGNEKEFEDIPAAMPFHRDGAWIPEQIGGRLRRPCAIARTMAAARRLVSMRPGYDVVVCDVVPHVLPWLKRRTSARLLYFGHCPDPQLTGKRRLLDRWESRGLGAAHAVVVNSRFTANALRHAFPELTSMPIDVLHPGVGAPKDMRHDSISGDAGRAAVQACRALVADDAIVLLSLGRFDPRKNLPLAIHAVAALRTRMAPNAFARVRLVFAGRLDDRLAEARETRAALAREAGEWNLADQVVFVDTLSAADRAAWFERALVVLYTAEAEHLGIVPLEAMAAGRPVIAVNRGDPLETVVVGRTGLLCEPTPGAFAAAIARFITEPDLARRMGADGRAHVDERFSRERFGDQLDALVRQLAARGSAAAAVTSKMRTAGVPRNAGETSSE